MTATLHNAHVNTMYLNVFSALSRLFLAQKTKEDLRNLLQALFSAAMLQTRDTFEGHARKDLLTDEAMNSHLRLLLGELDQGSNLPRLVVDLGDEYGEKSLDIVLMPQCRIWDSCKIDTVKDVATLFPLIKWGK